MKKPILFRPSILLLLALVLRAGIGFSQSTTFQYQGLLAENGVPANGAFDIAFSLHDDLAAGQLVAGHAVPNVVATNGLFTAELDFGAAPFDGTDYWLELSVSPAGAGTFETLTPRQPLTAAPYALHALSAGSVPGGALINPEFFGNTDSEVLVLNVANQNALRLEPDPVPAFGSIHSFNVLAGYSGNVAVTGARGATIGGGGSADTFGLPFFELQNQVTGDFGTIAGGLGNQAGAHGFVGGGMLNVSDGRYGSIAGGSSNHVGVSALHGAVGGGWDNAIGPGALQAAVAGGRGNMVQAGATQSAVGGGAFNTVSSNATHSVITGGQNNLVGIVAFASVVGGGNNNQIAADRSLIAGGSDNLIEPTGDGVVIGGGIGNFIGAASANSVIAGGSDNIAASNTEGATISGGENNEIGTEIFYATIGGGLNNRVVEGANSSVISGGENNVIGGNAAAAAVSGGLRNTNSGSFASIPGGVDNLASGRASLAAGTRAKALHNGSFVWADGSAGVVQSTTTNQFITRASGGVKFFSDPTLTFGVELLPGEGTFTSLSDRHLKENLAPIDAEAVLDRVSELPIQSWNYRGRQTPIRHIGPMAQDFHAAFGVGHDERHIATIDADGVALAAIQGLHARMQKELRTKDQEIEQLHATVEELKALVHRLLDAPPAGE